MSLLLWQISSILSSRRRLQCIFSNVHDCCTWQPETFLPVTFTLCLSYSYTCNTCSYLAVCSSSPKFIKLETHSRSTAKCRSLYDRYATKLLRPGYNHDPGLLTVIQVSNADTFIQVAYSIRTSLKGSVIHGFTHYHIW